MDNLLDIYTKLKLKVGNKIIVTYYTNENIKETKEAILLNINYFSSINIKINKELINIPFFSENIIIESISFKNQNTPIYYNPYFSKYQNPFINYKEIKEKTINPSTLSTSLKEKNRSLNKYLARLDIVTYEDLFFSEKQKEEFQLFFDTLVKELSDYAKSKGLDPNLKQINAGTTSIVYEIGDKIIKIGKPRRCNNIPYCEYILQPIINRIFEFDGYPIHIEVTEKVVVINNENELASFTKEQYYNEIVSILKKRLHSIGLKTQDLHSGNVGILINDNKIHYDDILFDTSPDELISIENNNNYKILPKGSFVIIDLDSLEIENKRKYNSYLKTLQPRKKKIRVLQSKLKKRKQQYF